MSSMPLAQARTSRLHSRVRDLPELPVICAAWERQHSREVRQLAWLAIEMGELLTDRLSQGGKRGELKAMMDLHIDCIKALTVQRGIKLDAVNKASEGLVRAIETTAYLAMLPD
ncbi:MAG: hypothetical protein V4731_19045 [Pseudomonadota bacterium]